MKELEKSGGIVKGFPNYLHIPTKSLDTSEESVKLFNKIFLWCKKNKNLGLIEWTSSGGISLTRSAKYGNVWGWKKNGWLTELTLIYWVNEDTRMACRWQFGRGEPALGDRTGGYSGRKAIQRAKKDALAFGFNLDDLAIKNGMEVKKTIPAPLIWVDESILNRELDGVHHIDFRSSHCFGMFESFPQLEEMIRFWYSLRKKSEVYKNQLVMTWGAFQSPALCGAKWSHISKAGIESTNRRVLEMVDILKRTGRKILCLNTDGIWYQGEIYHGENEGDDIGQWTNDHQNCKIRFKSRGAYEFIEDNQYYPVFRGRTNLDNIKPRSQWEWGDIFHEKCISSFYKFDSEKGILPLTEEELENAEAVEKLLEHIKRKKIDKLIK